MWSYGTDFVGDGQPMLATEFFGHSRGSIADEDGVVDLPTEADPIGDDVDMQVIGVFVILILWFRPMRTDVITALSSVR